MHLSYRLSSLRLQFPFKFHPVEPRGQNHRLWSYIKCPIRFFFFYDSQGFIMLLGRHKRGAHIPGAM